MSELGDFLMTALAFFVFAFLVIGAVGGWFVIVALIAREGEREREENRHAREDIVRANPIGVRDIRV